MNQKLWYAQGDQQLATDLADLLDICQADRRELWKRLDPELLRDSGRRRGWLMEVRAADPETFLECRRAGDLSLLVAGERALLLQLSGRRLTLQLPGGGQRTVSARTAFAQLGGVAIAEQDRRREGWRRLGIQRRHSDRVESKLGPELSGRILGWLDDHPWCDAVGVLEFARRTPGLLPLTAEITSAVAAPWREIRFTRQVWLASDRSPWRSLVGLFRQETGLLLVLLALAMLAIPLGFAMSMFTAFLLDHSRLALTPPLACFALMLAMLISLNALGTAREFASVRLGVRLRIRLMNAYLSRILTSRTDRVRTLGDGDLFTRLNDLFTLQQLMIGQALPLLMTVAGLIGGAIYLGMAARFVIGPMLLSAVVVAVFLVGYTPRLRLLRHRQLENTSVFRNRLVERLEGRRVYKHYDRAGALFRRVDPFFSRVAEFGQQGTVLASRLALTTGVTGTVFAGTVTWMVATRFQQGEASLGALVVVIGLAIGALQSLIGLMNLVPVFVAVEPALRRVREVLAITEPEANARVRRPVRSGPAALTVSDLNFAWRDGPTVLRGLSLALAPGEWAAVIGTSGCGKSTLASILGGLLAADGGRICIDGLQEDASRAERRSRVAVVTQEPVLFSRSVRENITLGCHDVSDEELAVILHLSGLTEMVACQPHGVDQQIGENGRRISVGEKCRLSLARALVRKPGLLVLDEVLARLDAVTAMQVRHRLHQAGVTVLLLTHDLFRARDCDSVHVLRDGCIVESGTFTELMNRGGDFANLFAVKVPYPTAAHTIGDR